MILPRHAVLASVLALLPSVVLCAEKARSWQTGKVVDTERSRYFAGTVGNGNTTGTVQENGTYQGSTNNSQTAVYRVYQTFAIEDETQVYMAEERLRWRWSKPANLTVNGPVKFAIQKRKLYVLDDDGKEHEMEIIKHVLKQVSTPQRP